jgi:hypothetical protein
MNVFLILDEFKARVYSDIVTVSVSMCLNIRNNNYEIDSVPIRYFRHISTENVNDNGNRVVFDSLSIRMHHYLLDLSSCTINYQDYDF